MSEERINELKEKVAGLQEELKELTPEELEQVTGGDLPGVDSSNHVSSYGFEYIIPKPCIR